MPDEGVRVLIVDDERPIRLFLRTALVAHGHAVSEAANGREAIRMVAESRPDLVVLDLGLPDMDGVEVVRQLREWTQVPIIILSVREDERDKVASLDAGADDYLTKPFGVGELLARMRVALRHITRPEEGPVFRTQDLTVDLSKRIVWVGGREIALTPIEYDLLKALISHPGKVLTHRQLLRQVWGVGYQGETHLLRVHVSNLRSKLETDPARPRFIVTEPRVGYRLPVPDP